MAEASEHTNIAKRVVEELVDVLVYAPVGLAATVVEELPALVEKGRSRLTMARTIGQFAVVVGRQRIGQAVAERRRSSSADEAGEGDGDSGRAVAEDAPVTQPAPHHRDRPEHGGDRHKGTAGPGEARPAAGDGAAPDPATLAIPGYDSLAASQVVQRLAGLSAEELAAVERYEEATRGRRTILGRIAQLSSSQDAPEHE